MSRDDFSNVAGGVLIKLLILSKDDDSHVDLAEDGELMRLLEKTTFTFQKSATYALAVAPSVSMTEHTLSGFCRP